MLNQRRADLIFSLMTVTLSIRTRQNISNGGLGWLFVCLNGGVWCDRDMSFSMALDVLSVWEDFIPQSTL